MVEIIFVSKQLTTFHKIIDELQNIEVRLAFEYKVLLLLISLSRFFYHAKDTILYGKECIITGGGPIGFLNQRVN